MKTLSLSEAKIKLSALIDGIGLTDEEVIITKNGRPAAVLVSPSEFESWNETFAICSDDELMSEIKEGISALKKKKATLYTLDELFENHSWPPSFRSMPKNLYVPDEIVELIRGMHPLLKKRVKRALNEICNDPHMGKALKQELSGFRSFRIKRFRIIYRVSSKKQIEIIAIGPRKVIYEETYKLIKKDQK